MKYLRLAVKTSLFALMGVAIGAIYDPMLALFLGVVGALIVLHEFSRTL